MPASEDFTPLDTLKRYLSAPRRAVGEGLSALATLPQRAFEASERMRTEGPYDPGPALEAAMLPMGTGAVAGVQAGGKTLGAGPIRAYHSSPHDFDKFDLAKIGTGEGAQVYGHGLYLAENPKISGQGGHYWNQFLRRFKGEEEAAARRLQMSGFDRETAAKLTQEARDRYTSQPSKYLDEATVAQRQADLQRQHELLMSGKPVGPRTYEVDIKADPIHMLNWDKPFHGQHAVVQDALARSGLAPETSKAMALPTGPMAVGQLKDPASLLNRNLDKAGIPAIKYLDEQSRHLPSANQFRVGQPYSYRDAFKKADQGWYVTSQPGGSFYREYGPFKSEAEAAALRAAEPWKTSNYVVRDPSILDIVKKYGLAGLAGAPALAGGLRDKDQQ